MLGGNAAVTIAGGGAAVDIIDGLARDIPEVDASGLIVLATTFASKPAGRRRKPSRSAAG